jgi:biotin--protein ligase
MLICGALILAVVYGSILIYSGPGASLELIEHLESTLLSSRRINYSRVTLEHLAKPNWAATCDLLIIPGGRDLEYVRLLDITILDRIRDYINRGGRYLGICGGAYFASSKVEFEVGTQFEVVGTRQLALYNGTAYGTAYRPFTYSPRDARAAGIVMNDYKNRKKVVKLLHAGGCYFDANEVKADGWRAIGTHANGRGIAIIAKNIGKGVAVLCCPHIEFNPHIPSSFSHGTVKSEIMSTLIRRQNVFNHIISNVLRLRPTSAL